MYQLKKNKEPLFNTIDDFLDMIKETKSEIVLMLTQLEFYELKGDDMVRKEKNADYYNESCWWYSGGSKYSLCCKEGVKIKGLTKREITFKEKNMGESYSFVHFLYDEWYNEESLDELKLYDLVNALYPTFFGDKMEKKNVIVHCR